MSQVWIFTGEMLLTVGTWANSRYNNARDKGELRYHQRYWWAGKKWLGAPAYMRLRSTIPDVGRSCGTSGHVQDTVWHRALSLFCDLLITGHRWLSSAPSGIRMSVVDFETANAYKGQHPASENAINMMKFACSKLANQ